MHHAFQSFQPKFPVTMRPTLSRQEWNINLGKLHRFTSNLLLLITWSTLFLIALFIALEQTHCTLVACDSKQMTTAFSSMLWIFTKIVYLQCCTYSGILFGSPLLHGWCHVKLLLSQCMIQPCTMSCHFVQCHIHKVHTYVFSCNLPHALLAEQPGCFKCYCGNRGVKWIPKYESAHKVDNGEQNSPTAPARTWTHPWPFHLIRSLAF